MPFIYINAVTDTGSWINNNPAGIASNTPCVVFMAQKGGMHELQYESAFCRLKNGYGKNGSIVINISQSCQFRTS